MSGGWGEEPRLSPIGAEALHRGARADAALVTKSKRARNVAGKSRYQLGSSSVPAPPGPPGLKKMVPIRLAESVAARR
jgi:hypothetical protein